MAENDPLCLQKTLLVAWRRHSQYREEASIPLAFQWQWQWRWLQWASQAFSEKRQAEAAIMYSGGVYC